jgi:hypothetical protein
MSVGSVVAEGRFPRPARCQNFGTCTRRGIDGNWQGMRPLSPSQWRRLSSESCRGAECPVRHTEAPAKLAAEVFPKEEMRKVAA